MPPDTRVLVIDDHDALRKLIKRIIDTQDGFVADEARNGRVALQMIDANRYDVITLDLMMPDMDGFAVIAALERDHPEMLPHVVVMTAFPQSAIDRLDRRCAVVSKPFNAGELLDAIQRCAPKEPDATTIVPGDARDGIGTGAELRPR